MDLVPQCLECQHYKGKGKCDAFDDIPDNIFIYADFDHKKPHKNDKGIRYKQIKTTKESK